MSSSGDNAYQSLGGLETFYHRILDEGGWTERVPSSYSVRQGQYQKASTSMKHMSVIAERTSQLNDLQAKQANLNLCEAVQNVGTQHALGKKQATVEQLTEHLRSILEPPNKQVLLSRLLQPFAGESVSVQPHLQREVCQLLSHMGQDLSSTPVETLAWGQNLTASQEQLDALLAKCQKSLATLKRFYSSLTETRRAMQELPQ